MEGLFSVKVVDDWESELVGLSEDEQDPDYPRPIITSELIRDAFENKTEYQVFAVDTAITMSFSFTLFLVTDKDGAFMWISSHLFRKA